MADTTTLSLDIKNRMVAGVHVLESKRSLKVLMAHCCFLGPDQSGADGVAEVVEYCKAGGARCLVSLGAEHFHFRSFKLPFADRKKARSVIPLEVEDSVSFSEEEFVFDYLLELEEGGSHVLAAILKKPVLQSWLDMLAEYNLDPELITISGVPAAFGLLRSQPEPHPSQALLNVGFSKATLLHLKNRQIRAIRSLPYNIHKQAGFTWSAEKRSIDPAKPQHAEDEFAFLAGDVENTLFSLIDSIEEKEQTRIILAGPIGSMERCHQTLEQEMRSELAAPPKDQHTELAGLERMTERWPKGTLDDALALACAPKKERERLNFRKGEFAFRGGVSQLPIYAKGALAALLVLCLGFVSYQLFDYQNMKSQRDQIDQQLVALYQNTLPGATPGPEPVKEMQIKVNSLRETSSVNTNPDQSMTTVKLLADISTRIPQNLDVSLERFIYDRKTVRLRGITDNFNSVDLMKKSLEQSPFYTSVSIGSANVAPKEKGVKFELKLQL